MHSSAPCKSNWMAPWMNRTSRYIYVSPITQCCSISDVLFTRGRGVSDFSILKYYKLNINYSVNILSECLRILIDCSQLSKTIITGCSVLPPKIIMHDAYIGRRKSLVKPVMRQKTCNYIELFGFFCPRSSCMMHLMLFSECLPIYATRHMCMTITGGRTEQLDIIAGFLLSHWLYEWFSQFHSCGTYSVLSQSHSFASSS